MMQTTSFARMPARQNHIRCKRLFVSVLPSRVLTPRHMTDFLCTVRDLLDEQDHLEASAHTFELAMWTNANFRDLERRLLDRENVRRTWALLADLPPGLHVSASVPAEFDQMVHDLQRFAAIKCSLGK